MTVTTIKAAIRMSRQTDSGTWATVELGAEESGIEQLDQPWQDVQADLYHALKAQIKALWKEALNTVVPPAPGNGRQQTPGPDAAVDKATGEIVECPEHHKAKESRFGGFYCPERIDEETFCKWTVGRPKAKGKTPVKKS